MIRGHADMLLFNAVVHIYRVRGSVSTLWLHFLLMQTARQRTFVKFYIVKSMYASACFK